MRKTLGKSLILTTLLGAAAIGNAEVSKTSQPKSAEVTKQPPAIDPNAIGALKKMGAFLREQQNFSVRTKSETDLVLDPDRRSGPRPMGN